METSAVFSPKKRPDFLTVICILTFIGSGFGIINNVTNYLNADVLTEMGKQAIDQNREKVDSESSGEGKKLADQMMSGASAMMDKKKLKQNYLLTVLSNIMTLAGALLMFRLRKSGYWLYVAGIVVLVATPVVIFGTGNLLSMSITMLFAAIGILFIILYSLQLRHLH